MNRKKTIFGVILCGLLAAGCAVVFVNNSKEPAHPQDAKTEGVTKEPDKSVKQVIKNTDALKADAVKTSDESAPKEVLKKTKLYDVNNPLPLYAIAEIADVSPMIRKKIEALADDSQNVLFMERKDNRLVILREVTSDSAVPRHELEFVEINTEDGSHKISRPGYNGEDAEYDVWQYDEISKLPLKHIKYNKENEVEFTEIWHNNPDDSVKYEMKNGQGNPISILKETITNDTNMRREHVFYTKNGEVRMNISANYDGANMTRFTYYNADSPDEGASVFSEYADGVKTKETVYTTDYKIKNIYRSSYEDGLRTDITIFDNQNKEIEKLLAE